MSRGVVRDFSQSIGTQQVTLLSADPSRTFLLLSNSSASGNAAINFAGLTAQINGLGCVTLSAGSTLQFGTGIPTNKITAAADTNQLSLTCQVIQGGSEFI